MASALSKKIFLSLFIVTFLIHFDIYCQNEADSKPQYLYNPNYELEIGKFKNYRMKQADIVMLGNSITHGANWNELLGRQSISEQGIPGDISEGVLNRLEYVYKLKPQVCFIMVGVNDVFAWIPTENVFQNYVKIIESLKKKNIIPIIQSVLYAAEIQPSAQNRNVEIAKLNKLLLNYSRENGYEFVDLNKKMSRNNFLKSNLTYDGIHLNGEGFKYWGREIDKILRRFSL